MVVEVLTLIPALWIESRVADPAQRQALATRLGLYPGPWHVTVTDCDLHHVAIELVGADDRAFGEVQIERRNPHVEARHLDARCAALFEHMSERLTEAYPGYFTERHPPVPWQVFSSHLNGNARNLGLGMVLYREAVRAAARRSGFLFPDLCFTMGTTSAAARQVWTRLAEDETLLAVTVPSGWPIVLTSPRDLPGYTRAHPSALGESRSPSAPRR